MKKWLVLFIVFTFPILSYASSFKTQKWQTKNGARVIFYPAKEVPMLDLKIAFAAGSAYDNQFFGLSDLTTRMLNQGNASFDASQIAERLADTGAQYNSENNRDMVVLSLKTLTEETALEQAVETFMLIVNKPNFQQAIFNREKNQQLYAITQRQESPDNVANDAFFNKLYPNHPYGHPVNGTIESVKKINNWQIRNFYKRYFVSSNAVIVLVGAISEEKAHQIAERVTQYLPQGEAAPAIPKAAALSAKENLTINYPSSQTVLRMGQLGIDHKDPDYFPLLVGNYILGGGVLVSRLSYEVREQRGLTYGITSEFAPMPGDGPFLISLSTKNEQATSALEITRNTLTEFLKAPPSEDELNDAKKYLTGSYPLSLASNSSIAGMLLRIAFYQLPEDFLDTYIAHVESVSAEEIKKAFDSHINPEKMLVVSVGKM